MTGEGDEALPSYAHARVWEWTAGRCQKRAQGRELLSVSRQLLSERGHSYFAESSPPDRIDARLLGTAVLAEVRFGRQVRRLVLKPIRLNQGVSSVRQLVGILDVLARSSPRIAHGLPTILGTDEPRQMLIMEYVDGESLERRLAQALGAGNSARAGLHEMFREVAAFLAVAHRDPADDLLPGIPIRENGSFVPAFELAATAWFRPVFEKAGLERPSRLVDRLTPGFFDRRGDRMHFVDAGPKNLIIRTSGSLCFIDIDCLLAPAALGVAQFLAALDRIGTRWPSRRAQRRLAEWKRIVVDAYCDRADATVAEDLTFFYPWAVLNMFEQHRGHQPVFAPYLHWYYGQRLERFLRALNGLSRADVARTPGALFEPAGTRSVRL